MSWKIKVSSKAEKYFGRLDKDMRKRIKETLLELSKCTNPLLHGSIRLLTGELKEFCRLRVVGYRIVFGIINESNTIAVINIAPRGDAY
jgi:mRNA interferase RelE/StbE